MRRPGLPFPDCTDRHGTFTVLMNHVGSASAMDLEQSVGRARKKLAYAPWHMPGAIWFSESLLSTSAIGCLYRHQQAPASHGKAQIRRLDTTEGHLRRTAVRSGTHRGVPCPCHKLLGRTRRRWVAAAKSTGPATWDYQVITAGAVAC